MLLTMPGTSTMMQNGAVHVRVTVLPRRRSLPRARVGHYPPYNGITRSPPELPHAMLQPAEDSITQQITAAITAVTLACPRQAVTGCLILLPRLQKSALLKIETEVTRPAAAPNKYICIYTQTAAKGYQAKFACALHNLLLAVRTATGRRRKDTRARACMRNVWRHWLADRQECCFVSSGNLE